MAGRETATYSTYADVEQVRSILLTRVPYELADVILNEAQYWARLSTKRSTFLRIQASQEPMHNAKWCYMVSEPVPAAHNGDRVMPVKVKSVRFLLRSCDQGWGGFSEGKNTYRNSYTWFEASILRPPTSTSPSVFQEPPEWITSTALYGPTNITSRDGSDSGWVELSSPYRTNNRRWLVQMNAQASHHIRHHEVVWSSTDASTTAELRGGNVGGAEYDEKTGSGRGLGFVDSLQSGDRIALIARALYPGWENNVYGAEIEIAYQI